jgi:Transposase DNA-binding/Transposase Tn5 dimerisation domain
MQPWIEEELRTADLPDERLNRRFAVLLDQFSSKPSLSIPAACRGWNETLAAYRFFNNKRVEPALLLQPHVDATLERIRAQPVVLIAQDTTELVLDRPREKVGGPLDSEKRWGFHAHVMLALTPERLTLGVVDSQTWARDSVTVVPKPVGSEPVAAELDPRYVPIEQKESFRWLQGYRRACFVAAQAVQTQVVCLSDSEGDIYECFHEAAKIEGPKAEWIVRTAQDRVVASNDDSTGKLWQTVAAGAVLGRLEIDVSERPAAPYPQAGKRRGARSARRTTVTVQACRVTLQAPWRGGESKLPDLAVNVVLVLETNPPPGEEPIQWLLLTSLPVGSFAEACAIIGYYACRWEIEIFFRVLKSGCAVEELQLETAERFLNCLSLYLIVAWRVLFVMHLGRECPEMPCSAVFTTAEWKAVYAIVQGEPPTAVPRLGDLLILIAQLGGYLNRTGDSPPGPKAIWIGLQRTRDFALAYERFGPRTPDNET